MILMRIKKYFSKPISTTGYYFLITFKNNNHLSIGIKVIFMKLTTKLITVILSVLLIFIVGCKTTPSNTNNKTLGVNELLLNEQDLAQIGMAVNINPEQNAQLGIDNGTNCRTEKYDTSEFSPLAEYSICYYNITSLNDTIVIVELKKFTNLNDLNGSYGYSSSHLFGAKGLISENDFGDQSRFRVSDPSDYGGEFNKPNVYYYNLYFTKGLYLIHVTSGKNKEAKDYIAKTGRQILSKFE